MVKQQKEVNFKSKPAWIFCREMCKRLEIDPEEWLKKMEEKHGEKELKNAN